jgi:hypothetical protein
MCLLLVRTDAAPGTIVFPARNRARVVYAPRSAGGGDLARGLGVRPERRLVVLNGGTLELEPAVSARLGALLSEGLARVVAEEGLTVITGGTDAGVFALFGQGLGEGATVTCIGVAPARLVTWPGRTPVPPEAVPLEPHHSHFVLVEGDRWGDETAVMMGLADALAGDRPSVAVLAGGGTVARRELLAHVDAGREVIVLAGSGRLADEIAAAVAGEAAPAGAETREAVDRGRITAFDTSRAAADLRDLIRTRLR